MKEAIDSAFTLAADTLELHDGLAAIAPEKRTDEEEQRLREAVGLLNEITPLLLFGGRHRTSKLIAMPALSFDDAIRNDGKKVDTTLYDNRVIRKAHNFSFQIKTTYPSEETLRQYDPFLTIVTAREFGNDVGSKYWPNSNQRFTSLRLMLCESDETLQPELKPELSSALDRISSDVLRYIKTANGTVIMEVAKNATRRHGAELARLMMDTTMTPDERNARIREHLS